MANLEQSHTIAYPYSIIHGQMTDCSKHHKNTNFNVCYRQRPAYQNWSVQLNIPACSISNSGDLVCPLGVLFEFLLWFTSLSLLILNYYNWFLQSRVLRFFEKTFWKMRFYVGVWFVMSLESGVIFLKLRLVADRK